MKNAITEFKPFLSVLLLIATLFSLVIFKMEVRRVGYEVLKAMRETQSLKDQNRLLEMEYARMTRPEHIRKFALSKLTLNDARNGQIIQLTGRKLALPQ